MSIRSNQPLEFDENALEEVRRTRLLIDGFDRWLFNEYGSYLGQRVFEAGCGLGNQITLLKNRELVVGTDISDDSIAEVRRKFEACPNVLAFTRSILDPGILELTSYRFDTAISVNVFEHIGDDEQAMRNVFALLQPGGRFILIVPAHEWLYGSLDSSIGHYRRYTIPAARQKLESAGFRLVKQKYINSLGALGWWFNGRVLKKDTPPAGQLKLLNPMLPVLEKVERLIPLSLGISLLSIAEKPE